MIRKLGSTSNILRILMIDSATANGKTGLTSSSTGLVISTIANNEASPTAYTSAGSTVEGITTLGTYAAPTATKCRFKEIDATNHPGLYELQLADARFAVAGAKTLNITISGVATVQQSDLEIQLSSFDLDSSAVVLSSSGLDAVLIESGITASGFLIDDASTQLTSINARQCLSLCAAALAAKLFDNGSNQVLVYAAGKPAVTRIDAAIDGTGRTQVDLVVPV